MGISHKLAPTDVQKLIDEQLTRLADDVADKICELNGDKAVSAVFVVGGGGKFPGFTDKIADRLQIARERVAVRGEEVLTGIDFVTNEGCAVGYSYRNMYQLLQPEEQLYFCDSQRRESKAL